MTALTALMYASAVWAETFTVNNTNDSGPGSLREALARANSTAGGDEIAFADGLGGTILLGESAITDEAGLSVDGGGDVTVTGTFVVSRGRHFPSGTSPFPAAAARAAAASTTTTARWR